MKIFSSVKKHWKGILITLIIVIVYLNIGWHLGGYYHNNIHYSQPQTFFAKCLAGGFDLLSVPSESIETRFNETQDRQLFMFLWLTFVIIAILAWIVYGLYCTVLFLAVDVFWGSLKNLYWLCFQGGLFTILGSWNYFQPILGIIIFVGGFAKYVSSVESNPKKFLYFILAIIGIVLIILSTIIH